MTEQELCREVERLAEEHDVFYHHCRDSRHCSAVKGLPDYILTGRQHTMFVECKSSGKRTRQQRLWKERLEATGMDYELWTPYDLKTGHIQEIMAWL